MQFLEIAEKSNWSILAVISSRSDVSSEKDVLKNFANVTTPLTKWLILSGFMTTLFQVSKIQFVTLHYGFKYLIRDGEKK